MGKDEEGNTRGSAHVGVQVDCSRHRVDRNDVRGTDVLFCLDLKDSDAMLEPVRRMHLGFLDDGSH